jgi:tetratricopeptide (TPR) repeat protein
MKRKALTVLSTTLAICVALPLAAQIRTLQADDAASPNFSRDLSDLQLETARRVDLENAISQRDYKHAETILVEEAEHDPKSTRAAKLFAIAGGVFFLNGEYLNSAIAWKRAEAIAPLDDRNRFTLAMAYIKLNRRDWARPELDKLAAAQPHNPLYLYWLARLDYDAQNYTAAIARLQRVLELDPKMMRAYDSLGLCYDYLGQFDQAIQNYNHAIDLNRLQAKPSPWPHVDLAASLVSVSQLAEAEKNLREAIGYDAQLPQAHYQLGRVLEMRGDLQAAVQELNQAVALEPAYPEPHLLLGRIYHRLGQDQQAEAEIARYQELKKASEAQPPPKFFSSPH